MRQSPGQQGGQQRYAVNDITHTVAETCLSWVSRPGSDIQQALLLSFHPWKAFLLYSHQLVKDIHYLFSTYNKAGTVLGISRNFWRQVSQTCWVCFLISKTGLKTSRGYFTGYLRYLFTSLSMLPGTLWAFKSSCCYKDFIGRCIGIYIRKLGIKFQAVWIHSVPEFREGRILTYQKINEY